jgi:hypothetical protein
VGYFEEKLFLCFLWWGKEEKELLLRERYGDESLTNIITGFLE